jgi:Fe2+ transport system protein B
VAAVEPALGRANQRDSYFGKVSGAIAPVFAPLGFDNWETGGALVSGFMAKEIVVSTMSQVYLGEMERRMWNQPRWRRSVSHWRRVRRSHFQLWKDPAQHPPRRGPGG